MTIKITSPGHPDLFKSSLEVQALLRKRMNDDSVDLLILNLSSRGHIWLNVDGIKIRFEMVADSVAA